MSRRKLPIMSELILLAMNSMTAFLYLLLPPRVNAYISTFMVGGLFGLMIPPLLFLHLFCTSLLLPALDSLLPETASPSLGSIYAALGALYVTTVLVMDSSHLAPPPLGVVRKPSNFLERCSLKFWSSHFTYFPMSVHAENLDPSAQYVFGVHPHGIHCWALNVFAFQGGPLDSLMPLTSRGTLSGLAASVIFMVPVVRELFLQMGYVDASRVVATKAMDVGRSLFICTGGEEESMMSEIGRDVVVIKKRKGFVRLAVKNGAALVPVFGVGITDLYKTYGVGRGARMWVQKKFGIALPIFHGRFMSP
ncbi:hypothetical protein TrRE_jg3999, partial [Triparma retinervis]